MSRGSPSNGVCSRDLVVSRASSTSRISTLTASAMTGATTSLHASPPFIVVRLVRELMSVRVHVARFLPPRKINSGLVVSSWTNCELNLWMWLCISFHDRVFVNRSAPLSTPATFLKFKSPFAAFSWIHKSLVSRCLNLPNPRRATADALTKPHHSASAELRATTACVLHHIVMG